MLNERKSFSLKFDSDKKVEYLFIASLIFNLLLVVLYGRGVWSFNSSGNVLNHNDSWTRPLLRDVTSVPDSLLQYEYSMKNLPGQPIALQDLGVEQNDFANLIENLGVPILENREVILRYLGVQLKPGDHWLVMLVTGELTDSGKVGIIAKSYLLLTNENQKSTPELLSWQF